MKVIFSYWGCESNRYTDILMAQISHSYVSRLGYETIGFFDKKNINKFDEVRFGEKRILDNNILNKLPQNIWSLGKLLVFATIDEPFIHIDFDVFMLENHIKQYENKDLFCFHKEPWRPINHFDYIKNTPLDNKYLNIKNNAECYNCAIIGGSNFKQINDCAKEVLDYIINNKDYLYDLMSYELRHNDDWSLPVFIEQILFMNICKYKLNLTEIPTVFNKQDNIDDIFASMKEKKTYHLWGEKKYFMDTVKITYLNL